MGLELIRWTANERVGIPDQEAMTDLVAEELRRRTDGMLLRSVDGAQVLGGFGLTSLGAGLARLDYGRAILPVVKEQVETQGFFLGLQSPTSYQLDFSGAADDTYDVYIRAVYTDGTFENRVFWDPGSSAEFVDYVATRQVPTWEATYAADGAPSPGSEWVRLWSVNVASGLITGTTDRRPFFFEGEADGSYGHLWGDGANDRNADRATYGVQDRWTWDQGVRRQLADIIGAPVGSHGWWSAVPIELAQLAVGHYAEADGADRRGHHKDFQFGFPGRFMELATRTPGSNNWAVEMNAIEEATNTPKAWIWLGQTLIGPERFGVLRLMPYGEQLDPQNVGDYSGISHWYDAITEYWTNDATNLLRKRWKLSGTDSLMLEAGSAATEPGLHVLNSGAMYAEEGFWLEGTKDIYIHLPWSAIVPDDLGNRRWEMLGPFGADVGAAGVSVASNGNISGSKPMFFEFYHFPEGATLTGIDISWGQGSATSVNEMRMFAARHINAAARPSDSHDAGLDFAVGTAWTYQPLKSGNNYVEYAPSATTTETRRFKPDQNNTNWDRRKHKLVIGILPPNTNDTALEIYSIVTRWTYQEAAPWGRTLSW